MPVSHNTEEFLERIEACRELYLKHDGRHHELIEQEMRSLGYRDFHRRSLHRRFERGSCKPGWIEIYGWNALLKLRKAECGVRNEDVLSPTGTNNIAQGKAKGRNPGNNDQHHTDPEGVEQSKSYAFTREADAVSTQHEVTPKGVTPANDFEEFKKWLKRVSPGMTWEWKHQVYIYKYLERVTKGLCKRLMIFLPPRHGKSELVTVRYAAWRLKQNPSMKVIISSHSQSLANNFSRAIKRVLCDDALLNGELRIESGKSAQKYGPRNENIEKTKTAQHSQFSTLNSQFSETSPFPFTSTRPKNTEAQWETTMGGGLKAVGVGGGVTGFGADLIIIDDPVKSRAEAESKTFRDRLWKWFNDDIYTRLEPDGSIILIQTRWHEDDLAGRLLRESQEGGEQWEVISLPALAESRIENGELRMENEEIADPASNFQFSIPNSQLPADPLGRIPGQALCPERFNEQTLEQYRRKLGSYSFAALYQQRPSPAEGGMFKRAWFKIAGFAPPNLKWKRGYDLGISKNFSADYTASLKTAFDDAGDLYIDGAYRARIEYPEQRRYILGRINAEPGIDHGVELSANGNAVIQDLRREKNIQGRTLRGIKVINDKLTRALGWLALAAEGRVHLVRGAWNDEFIDEAAAFPQGRHDDQIDAVSLTIQMHREQKGRSHGFTWKELYGR